jgi:hypothetical protein
MKKFMTAFLTLSFMTGIAGFATASSAQVKPEDAEKTPAATTPAKQPNSNTAGKTANPTKNPDKKLPESNTPNVKPKTN